MERKAYIELCQRASFKAYYSRAWWRTKWNPDELVYWEGKPFVPVDYRFGFMRGKARHLAIIHDLDADAEYTVKLEEVTAWRESNPETPFTSGCRR